VTFIKLGQALSIWTDFVPAANALDLRQLQDWVTPFDSHFTCKKRVMTGKTRFCARKRAPLSATSFVLSGPMNIMNHDNHKTKNCETPYPSIMDKTIIDYITEVMKEGLKFRDNNVSASPPGDIQYSNKTQTLLEQLLRIFLQTSSCCLVAFSFRFGVILNISGWRCGLIVNTELQCLFLHLSNDPLVCRIFAVINDVFVHDASIWCLTICIL